MTHGLPFLLVFAAASSLLAMDSGPLPLSNPRIVPATVSEVYRTVAASSGTSYLLAFESRPFWDPRSAATYFRTYASDGTPLQSVAQLIPRGVWPSVAWSGSEYLIVWTIPWSSFAGGTVLPVIGALRVDADGNPIGDSVVLATSTDRPGRVAVAWNGSRYLIVAGAESMLVSRDLVTKTPLPNLSAATVASDGDRFALADVDGKLAIVSADATVISSANLGRTGAVAVAYAGGRYEVVVAAADGVSAITVSRDGIISTPTTLATAAAESPSIAASGDSL